MINNSSETNELLSVMNSDFFEFILAKKENVRILGTKIFPNYKEITESYGTYFALRKLMKLKKFRSKFLGNRKITVYSIGDGVAPRTAAVFAINSAFKVYSIDPIMNWTQERTEKELKLGRLFVHKCKAEDFTFIDIEVDISIIVGTHSHANFNNFWHRIPGKKIGIALPCCVKQEVIDDNAKLVLNYKDERITSPKNEIYVWTNFD